MKNLFLPIFLALILVSCGKEDSESESRDCSQVEYDNNFEVTLGDEVCFPDGNSFIVEDILYGFCPCDVTCIWEGELNVKLRTTNSDETSKEITLGTTTIVYDRNIFDNHEISVLLYKLIDDHNPECVEDFDPEKVQLDFMVSKI